MCWNDWEGRKTWMHTFNIVGSWLLAQTIVITGARAVAVQADILKNVLSIIK